MLPALSILHLCAPIAADSCCGCGGLNGTFHCAKEYAFTVTFRQVSQLCGSGSAHQKLKYFPYHYFLILVLVETSVTLA